VERKIEIARADDRIISLWNREANYLGGAHDGFYEGSANFDTETGKKLTLSDITEDYDAVCERIREEITTSYGEEGMLFDDYEETLKALFSENDGDKYEALEWTLDNTGLTVSFSPYVLAPWAAGTLYVNIPFAGNEALFKAEYLDVPEHQAKQIREGEWYLVDTDADGILEELSFSMLADMEDYSTKLQIFTNEEAEHGADQASFEYDELHGEFSDAYLMYGEDDHPWLYVEMKSENDYCLVEVFDLQAGDTPFCYAGYYDGAFGGHFAADAEDFCLYTKIDILGTHSGYRRYKVGALGLPEPLETVYRIVDGENTPDTELIVKNDIPAQIYTDGTWNDTILPAGTKLTEKRTDGETFVETVFDDGTRCILQVEKDEELWGFSIDGVNEFDCFESLFYAG
jgi:hypothetical protein